MGGRESQMRKIIAIFTVAIVAMVGFSAVASELFTNGVYGVSFEDYAVGDALTDLGSFGGTWGRTTVPAGVEAEAELKSDGTTMYMNCYAGEGGINTAGIAFWPTNECLRSRQSVEMSVRSGMCEILPTFPEGAKTGFVVYAPEGGQTSVVAWVGAKKCWTNLYLQSGIQLPMTQWQEVLSKFLKRDDGRLFVQYWLKVDGTYHVLRTQDSSDGVAWLDLGETGDGALVRKVELRGDGGIEYLNGTKPTQGLYVGIGRWRDVVSYDVAYTNDYGTGEWNVQMRRDEDRHAYVIDVAEGDEPNVFMPDKRRTDSESVEVAVRFTSTSRDESIPADGTCARVRLVAEPGMTYAQPDPVYRFACLVEGKWMTNTTVRASFEKDYAFQIRLDSVNGKVAYRVRDGIGYDSGAYVTLAEGSLPSSAFGTYADVYFEGSGLVYKIKVTDRTEDE